MEAWTQDLVTALDEPSFRCSREKSRASRNTHLLNGVHLLQKSKPKGNINESASSCSEGGMFDGNELPHPNILQATANDKHKKYLGETSTVVAEPSFTMPSIQNTAFGSIHLVTVNPPQNIEAYQNAPQQNLAESDSLNETVSPLRPYTRRKRRFKRMAVDPDPSLLVTETSARTLQEKTLPPLSPQKAFSFSAFASSSIFAKPRPQRKTKKKPIDDQKIPTFAIGKRKRSTRERSIECELEKISLNASPEDHPPTLSTAVGCDMAINMGLMNLDSMDLDTKQLEQVSSSSVSGSESDPGFFTNDDGREADDEQSDWYQESGPTWGVPGLKSWWEIKDPSPLGPSSIDFRFRPLGVSTSNEDDVDGEETEDDVVWEERKFHQLLKGSWSHLNDEAKDAYRLRMQKLRDRIPGREIRAGRRHLGAQRGPAFSILTSANEKLSRFLQDSAQSEIRLHPMTRAERDQLSQLAALYSLQMRSEGARGLKCPVLKKTSNTMQAVRIDMDRYGPSPSLLSDFKRQRKTPPASITSESPPEEVSSIDDAKTGSHILKSAGGMYTTALRPKGQDHRSPVRNVRAKLLGSHSTDIADANDADTENASNPSTT